MTSDHTQFGLRDKLKWLLEVEKSTL